MKLSGKQIESLQIALVAAFSQDELRQMVRTKLDIPLEKIVQNKDQGTVTFDLITWSERKGTLDALVIGATESNPTNPTLKAWRLKYDLLILLHHMALSAEKLQALYTQCKAKNLLSPPQIDFEQPEAVVDALCEMTIQPWQDYYSSPIIAFAQRLMPLTHQQDRLQIWIQEAFPVFAPALTPEDRQAMLDDIQAEESGRVEDDGWAYLMVEVVPIDDIAESKQYQILLIEWDTAGKDRLLESVEVSAKEMFTKIHELLLETLKDLNNRYPDRLVLEFSLPFDLFSLNIDECDPDSELRSEYPIHFRSLDRFKALRKDARIQTRWKNCWDRLKAQNCQFCDAYILWECDVEDKYRPIVWSNKIYARRDSHRYCAVFTDERESIDRKRAFLQKMTFSGGLLSSIWIGCTQSVTPDTANLREKIAELFDQRHIQSMSWDLQEHRRFYSGKSNHIANHLMVMWDPPERIPKKYLSLGDLV